MSRGGQRWWRTLHRGSASALLLAALLLHGSRADAAGGLPVKVADFEGSEEALATSLLVRAMLGDAGASTAGATDARVARLSARVDKQTTGLHAELRLEGSAGEALLVANATAAPGDVASLAAGVARAAASRLGRPPPTPIATSLGELRPYARAAAALGRGDLAAASSALQTAEPAVAEAVPAVRGVASALFDHEGIPTAARLRAGRLAGRTTEAIALADGKRSLDGAARGERIRLLLASGGEPDLQRAAELLGREGDRRSPDLVVARAELAVRRAAPDSATVVAGLLRPLLAQPHPDVTALVFVLRLPPGFLGEDVESLVGQAASRAAGERPELATLAGRVALRALRGRALTPESASLVRVEEVAARDLPVVGDAARALPSGGAALLGKVTARSSLRQQLQRGAMAATPNAPAPSPDRPPILGEAGPPGEPEAEVAVRVELPDSVPAGAVDAPAVALAPELLTPEAEHAAAAVLPLLATFPRLGEAGGRQVLLVQQRSDWSSLTRAYRPVPEHIIAGLRRGLGLPPHARSTSVAGGVPLATLSTTALRELGAAARPESDFVLAWRADTNGDDLDLQLTLFDTGSGVATANRRLLTGGDLTRLNPVAATLAGLLLALLGGLFAWAFLLCGHVEVELVADGGVERQVLMVRLSRTSERPAIDAVAFDRRYSGATPRRGFREHTNVDDGALFRLVAPGTWWVHVYGTQVRGGEPRALGPHLSRSTTVRRGRGSFLKFDLRLAQADYRVLVMDGKPRPNVAVWIDDARDRAVRTGSDGEAVITIPIGAHVIRTDAGDLVAEKKVVIASSRASRITIDVAFERRIASIQIPEEEPIPGVVPRARPPTLPPGTDGLAPTFPAGPATAPEVAGSTLLGAGSPAAVGMHVVDVPVDFGGEVDAHSRRTMPGPSIRTLGNGRYQLAWELGRGAMGVVYRARDNVLGRDVAIKVLADELRRNGAMLQLFLQEARAMAALNHPNLITVFDQGQDNGEAFMVMELIEGTSLEQFLEQHGRLPWQDVVRQGQQLCAGLAYAHERRIVHRDIKPGNIFLTRSGLLKLGDFGLARAVEKRRITQTNVSGTPAYMAPEQIRGADIDFRADLYAVGCTLFEMLTGRLVFPEGEPMFHHMYTPPPDPVALAPTTPPALSRIILACLEKDQEARTKSAAVLLEQLRAIAV